MKDALLLIIILAIIPVGYFVVKRIDVYLSNKSKKSSSEKENRLEDDEKPKKRGRFNRK